MLLWKCGPALWASLQPRAPLSSSFVQGEPPESLDWMSVQCWSLYENLSCSTQHNVAIIAPIQGNDTCLLVYPGPRKVDRDLNGGCWEKESFTDGWKSLLLSHLQFLFQGTGLLSAPRLQGLASVVNSAPCTDCVWRKGNFGFYARMLPKACPLLWVLPQEKSTLESLSNGNYGLVKTSGASVQLDASTLRAEVMPNP